MSPFGALDQQQQQQQGKSDSQIVRHTGHTVTTCLPFGGMSVAVGQHAQLSQHAAPSAVMSQHCQMTQQAELSPQPELSQLVLGLDGTWQTPSGNQVLPDGWELQAVDTGVFGAGF
jgi:hypothetical protein